MDAIEIDAVERKRQALLEDIETLPADVLQELADFITQLRQKAKASAAEMASEKEIANPYQELKEFGLIGYGEGPADLAANHKAYLKEGFGS
ncbi:MAG: hypothetical protein WBC73_00695 [Phormidesmis sp.]